MKTRTYLLSCAALFFAAACNTEAVVDTPSGSATIYFTASFEGQPGTRTELQPDGTSFFWSAHEGIMIYTSDGFSGAFTSDNEEPAATATFSGTFDGIPGPDAEFYAIYGGSADDAPILEGNFIVSEAPSTDYGFSGFSIDSQEVWRCYPAVSKAQGRSLYFQHVCGGARFCVSQPGITKVSFESKDGDRLVSKVGVSFNASGAVESVQPIVEPGEEDGYNKLTINAPEGGFAPGEYYYAPMIAGEHPEGLDITYYKDDGNSATYSLSKPITIHRAVFGKLDNLDAGLTFSNPDAPIQFADAYVKAVLVANFDTNADGEISYREAAAITDLGTAFNNNEDIKTFNELAHFSGLSCIAEEAFYGCTSLHSVKLPQGITEIPFGCFEYCTSLHSITIPAGVSEINNWAFGYCISLQSVTVLAENPPSLLGWFAFYDTNDCPIYVPGASVGAYKAEQYWYQYASRIFAIDGTAGEAIDLGLPSGLKWASYNVGASSPEDYGDYFAWGETEPYYSSQDPLTWKDGKDGMWPGYYWRSYKWCNGSSNTQTKYNTNSSYGTVDNKTVLDPEDDAAHVNWGGSWRMPTKEEQVELRTKCTWTWTTQNGVEGILVTGPNGKSIFLPGAGLWYSSELYYAGSVGYYWSSSLYTDRPDRAYIVDFHSDGFYSGDYERCGGLPVRPVTE